ncbi:fasciclin (plasmid) [Fulvitalea axinellae]|uniref:Fasciclin n=1 Tax=Fulvitalea axinellae TaxID=1182444 RepID=A0AAU9CK09_9BACT|nr:fasciclin [Fulvitalea axinellae]
MVRKRLCYLLLIGCFFFAACDEEKEHYDVPKDEFGTVVDVIGARANLSLYSDAIERLGLEKTLVSGSYTVFPPNDEAFDLYFQRKGYTSLDDLSEEELKGIVLNHVVNNAMTWEKLLKMHLRDWSEEDDLGPHGAGLWGFKRPTLYRAPFVEEVSVDDGKTYKVWQAQKFIPVMAPQFFVGLKELSDYQDLFPEEGRPYDGEHMANAKVKEKDIFASNGMIHELDRVIEPLPNIDRTMADMSDKFSLFRSLLDRFAYYSFSSEGTSKQPINELGYRDSVFVKRYRGGRGEGMTVTSVANDIVNYNIQDNFKLGEPKALASYIPTNEALQAYLDENFLNGRYASVDEIPKEVLAYLVGNHLCSIYNTWTRPSELDDCLSGLYEPLSLNKDQDVELIKWCNNGVIYGINKVIEPNIYKSVASRVLFDPDFSYLMRMFVTTNEVNQLLSNKDSQLTFFALSDQGFNDKGIFYDEVLESFTLRIGDDVFPWGGGSRLISDHLVDNVALDNITERRFLKAHSDIYICVENGRVYAGGNQEVGETIDIMEAEKGGNNGVTYLIAGRLDGPSAKAQDYLDDELYARDVFQGFKGLLEKANMTIPEKELTVFIPTNEAIEAAVIAGKIPGLDSEGNIDGDDGEATLKNYLNLYFLEEEQVFSDGQKAGKFRTFAKDIAGERISLEIQNSQRDLRIVAVGDMESDVRVEQKGNSDIMANKAAIHQINGVLLLEN